MSTPTTDHLPITATRITVAVTVAILAATAIIYAVWSANQPSDFDCAIQHADVELGRLQPWEVDDACR